MKLKIELLSDAVFGSGESVPGGEDISIITDDDGFPMIRGTSFKGVLRTHWENYLSWISQDLEHPLSIEDYFGKSDEKGIEEHNQVLLQVSNFTLSDQVKQWVKKEVDSSNSTFAKERVRDACTYLRKMTALENGTTKDGSLRSIRCIKKGLIFYGEVESIDSEMLKEVLPLVKWLGTMRTRGLGRVRVSELGGRE